MDIHAATEFLIEVWKRMTTSFDDRRQTKFLVKVGFANAKRIFANDGARRECH